MIGTARALYLLQLPILAGNGNYRSTAPSPYHSSKKQNADGTVTFKPANGWTYTRWTLNGNTLKIVLGEGHADDYIEGTLSISGTSASWNCYWADVDGKWTNKDKTHAIVHLQKQ